MKRGKTMPTLSMFYGIIVRMYAEKGGKHNLPHIHASYGGVEIVVDLDGNTIEGEMSKGKLKLLLAWIEIHREELMANWQLLLEGEPAFKIKPLD